jgi:hypothetical protein
MRKSHLPNHRDQHGLPKALELAGQCVLASGDFAVSSERAFYLKKTDKLLLHGDRVPHILALLGTLI